jgi:hypothetical protein
LRSRRRGSRWSMNSCLTTMELWWFHQAGEHFKMFVGILVILGHFKSS